MANFGKPHMGTWARVLDTNALERQQGDAFKQESYWPLGASQDTFSCIIVKVCQVIKFNINSIISDVFVAPFAGNNFSSWVPKAFPFRLSDADAIPRKSGR
jgi:hypothetical protein